MRLQYDQDLIESVVFDCANGKCGELPVLQIRRFQREREGLYTILDPDDRNTAFFRLHLEWFREWGMEKILTELLKEFPLVVDSLNLFAFRKARSRKEEGAELYGGSQAGRNGVMALLPERFAGPEALRCFLRHELMHLQDMVDPTFGYSPDLDRLGQNAAQQRLTSERYRMLWDITIDGRLTAALRGTLGTQDTHRRLFNRAYGFWSETKRDAVFDALWRGLAPRHQDLLSIASDPREVTSADTPLPGASCPLCGFSTFLSANPSNLSASVLGIIGKEFPFWTTEHGLCGRCADVYGTVVAS